MPEALSSAAFEEGAALPDGSVRWKVCVGNQCRSTRARAGKAVWCKKVNGNWLCWDCQPGKGRPHRD
ncbi:MAG: hypothetical protein AAB955_03370 [Patescibacteria group bacterium]